MHSHRQLAWRLKLSIAGNTAFAVFEFIAGIMLGSLSLVSDAANGVADALSAVISYTGSRLARRHPNRRKTFGYGRVTIIAAMVNAFILLAMALYIFVEAYRRIDQPPVISGHYVFIVAFIGLVINVGFAWLFKEDHEDLNIRSLISTMMLDAAASLGALLAGLVILLTGHTFVDALVSVAIGCLLVYAAWSVADEALHILLEGAPRGIDVAKVEQLIREIPGVHSVHDLHIWTITSRYSALTVHLVLDMDKLDDSTDLVRRLKARLRRRYNIKHATIETAVPHHHPPAHPRHLP